MLINNELSHNNHAVSITKHINMKHLLLPLFVLLCYNVNFSQTKKDSIIYRKPPFWSMKLGFDFVGYYGIETQLSYHFHKKYSVSLDVRQVYRASNNTPKNYVNSGLFYNTTKIYERLFSAGLLGGYLFKIPNTRSRIQLKAGFFFNQHKIPYNFERANPFLFGPNYRYKMKEHYYPSLVIAPELEFPLWNHYIINIVPKLLISSREINYMMNFSFNLCNFSSKVKSKNKKATYYSPFTISAGRLLGKYKGLHFDVYYIHNHTYAIGLQISASSMPIKKTTKDTDQLSSFGFSGNYIINTRQKKIRVLLGGSINKEFWKYPSGLKTHCGWLGCTSSRIWGQKSYYTYNLSPAVDIALGKWVGIRFNPEYVIAPYNKRFQLNVSLIFGNVKDYRKKQTRKMQ